MREDGAAHGLVLAFAGYVFGSRAAARAARTSDSARGIAARAAAHFEVHLGEIDQGPGRRRGDAGHRARVHEVSVAGAGHRAAMLLIVHEENAAAAQLAVVSGCARSWLSETMQGFMRFEPSCFRS